jgi:hypothetical protein
LKDVNFPPPIPIFPKLINDWEPAPKTKKERLYRIGDNPNRKRKFKL